MTFRVGPLGWGLAALLACPSGGSQPKEAQPAGKAVSTAPEPEPATASEEACPSWADLDVQTLPALPPGKYVGVMDEVWRRVLQKYYDPTIGCLDWPALREEYAAKVADATTQTDAYRIMNEMLGRLQQSHFVLHPPGPGDEETQGPASPPITVRWIGEQLVLVHSDLEEAPAGSVLLAVDGRGSDDIVARAKAESSRPAELAFQIGRGAAARISCAASGETHTLTLEDGAGRSFDAEVECERPEGELVTLGNLSNVPTRVEHRMIERMPIGVVAFNVWMLPMLPRIRAALRELSEAGMKALVLDLRGNPGGVGPMAMTVARLLMTEKVSLGTLQYRKFTQEFNVEPEAGAFAGPIAVLVDEGTASTSEIFTAGMKDLGRVTVVGAGPSAGAALPSIIEELPGGAMLQYAVGDYHSPKGTLIEGKGVEPDVVVRERREDFAANRDPVLEAAVDYLGKQLAKE